MSLKTVFEKVEAFVSKEIKGTEAFLEKAATIEKKVAQEIATELLPDLKTLYIEAKAAVPLVEANVAAIAEIIAEIETL